MIEITDGLTSISAAADRMEVLEHAYAAPAGFACAQRSPTGARVTVEFQRTSSLAPTQAVTVRYDFAADGNIRELTGIPKPIRTVVRQGRAVVYHYRLSHWIAASALLDFSGKSGRSPGASQVIAQAKARSKGGGAATLRVVAGATATGPSPA